MFIPLPHAPCVLLSQQRRRWATRRILGDRKRAISALHMDGNEIRHVDGVSGLPLVLLLVLCVECAGCRLSNIKWLGTQSFDMRNMCIHSSGLLLFAPPNDDDDGESDAGIEHTHVFLISNVHSSNKGYAYPVTIIRNAVFPAQFQQSDSPDSLLLLAFGHPMEQVVYLMVVMGMVVMMMMVMLMLMVTMMTMMTPTTMTMLQVGHHMFESILSAFVTIKAASLSSTSHTHVLLSSHYSSPPPPSTPPTPIRTTLLSMWATITPHPPLSIGQFLQSNPPPPAPRAPVCFRRAIVGSIQDDRVTHPTPNIRTDYPH